MDFDEAYKARMEKAFELVKPSGDWKAPIDLCVSEEALKTLDPDTGKALADVCEAVDFFTATIATVRPTVTPNGISWRVMADGYRAGPAGDH